MPELCSCPGKGSGKDEMHIGLLLGEINQDLFTVSMETKGEWLPAELFLLPYSPQCLQLPTFNWMAGYMPEVLWLLVGQAHTNGWSKLVRWWGQLAAAFHG